MAGKKKKPAKKRASWVGEVNTEDESGVQKPLVELNKQQRSKALEGSKSVKAVKPRRKVAEREETEQPPKRVATRVALQKAELREPTNPELRRGIKAVSTKPKRSRKKKASGPKTYKVGQAAKLGGKLVRVTAENIEDVNKEVRTTQLPIAGPDVMLPRAGARVPLEQPKGGVQPRLFVKEDAPVGKGVERKLKGFGVPAHQVEKKAWQAIGHLDTMRNHQPGSKEYEQNYLWFHRAHEAVRPMSKDVHDILSFAHKIYTAPKYGEQDKHINMIKDALSERISIGRAMEKRRAAASKKGNKKGNE